MGPISDSHEDKLAKNIFYLCVPHKCMKKWVYPASVSFLDILRGPNLCRQVKWVPLVTAMKENWPKIFSMYGTVLSGTMMPPVRRNGPPDS